MVSRKPGMALVAAFRNVHFRFRFRSLLALVARLQPKKLAG